MLLRFDGNRKPPDPAGGGGVPAAGNVTEAAEVIDDGRSGGRLAW